MKIENFAENPHFFTSNRDIYILETVFNNGLQAQ